MEFQEVGNTVFVSVSRARKGIRGTATNHVHEHE